MTKINGYWYSHDEITEALKKKGYRIICTDYGQDRRGNEQKEVVAIKDGKSQSVQSAALKEFQKKPALV